MNTSRKCGIGHLFQYLKNPKGEAGTLLLMELPNYTTSLHKIESGGEVSDR
ncbi:MAG: hypothetical protein ACRCUY_09860 [Thermoguttaceae bacterium]